jgi:hypothetical protein
MRRTAGAQKRALGPSGRVTELKHRRSFIKRCGGGGTTLYPRLRTSCLTCGAVPTDCSRYDLVARSAIAQLSVLIHLPLARKRQRVARGKRRRPQGKEGRPGCHPRPLRRGRVIHSPPSPPTSRRSPRRSTRSRTIRGPPFTWPRLRAVGRERREARRSPQARRMPWHVPRRPHATPIT